MKPTLRLRAWNNYVIDTPKTKTALVIGAGISGASVAYALAIRNWKVIVLERNSGPAQAGSGNSQGILYLKLSAQDTEQTEFLLQAYPFTLNLLQQLKLKPSDWSTCGLIQLAFDNKEHKRQQEILAKNYPADFLRAITQEEASRIAGVEVNYGGLYFRDGTWVHPPALVEALLAHPNIQTHYHYDVNRLVQDPETRQWQAYNSSQELLSASIAVIANAHDAKHLAVSEYLELKKIRGQVTTFAASKESLALKTVVCADGYVSPARLNQHCVGASFKFEKDDLNLTQEEHQDNLALLAQMLPTLSTQLNLDASNPHQVQGRAAFRVTSPDYLPLCGPLLKPEVFTRAYFNLTKDSNYRIHAPIPWQSNLYVSLAHGSRGMLSAPLCGEFLGSLINQEASILSTRLHHALNPNRFLVRDIIRHKSPYLKGLL